MLVLQTPFHPPEALLLALDAPLMHGWPYCQVRASGYAREIVCFYEHFGALDDLQMPVSDKPFWRGVTDEGSHLAWLRTPLMREKEEDRENDSLSDSDTRLNPLNS